MALDKHYAFRDLEDKHAKAWEAAHAFAPDMKAAKPYVIMMPPPNVTGTLHLGHALDNTLPDILIRHARMQGKAALYQPGTDHASIAVHVVLERQWRQEGKSRFDMGREKFLEEAWRWKDYSHGIISSQMRRLGISCDWDNERFTMDAPYSNAINKVFIELYNKGLIYRGQRLVNWDPNMQTAVSDLEVKHKEVQSHLWHFKYPYADGFTYADEKTGQNDGIVIATTRPETILADGAIALNPADPRAKDLVGKYVVVPIVERRIPIITDEYVDPDFGSGMVKITAAHDFNDFEVYKRHKDEWNIPCINLMTPTATMNENCPAGYVGMDRFDARRKVIEDFKELGLFVKEVAHTHQVPMAERDDTILEPYLTNQWFVKTENIAKKCLAAAESGELTFVNERDRKVYNHWLENIQDWCISRQLWWGHRIPAWYKGEEVYVGETAPAGEGWEQDEDILDTWFSSGLWPFVTQGWPEKTARLEKFYPGALINSGRDILFFWLVRMVMMGLELTDKVPFKTIYTHGLILDEHGQKMSKSKGNVVDPLKLMDTYGADALRLTMASIANAEDMRFSEQKVEQSRNFCTKLWNAARYMEMKGIDLTESRALPMAGHPVNQWLIAQLKQMFGTVDASLAKYEFNQAAHTLYHTVWGTWCDWYLELTKPLLAEDSPVADETRRVMGWGFNRLLRALHPVIPFVTEELWQQLGGEGMLIKAEWPHYQEWPTQQQALAEVDGLIQVVSALRQVRSENRVPNKASISVKMTDQAAYQRLQAHLPLLQALAGVESLMHSQTAANETDAVAVVNTVELIVPLAGVVDFAAEKERVAKEIAKAEAELQKISGMLGNPNFVDRAPAAVVEQNKARQAELKENLSKLKAAS